MITSNASTLIKQLRAYKRGLLKKEHEVVEKLVDKGTKIANKNLAKAEYTGYKDAAIAAETHKKKGYVSMVGYDAGFIEFGTGAYYTSETDSHPKASEFGAIRGDWGWRRGANPPWIFPDLPGNARTTRYLGNGKSITYGVPANRTMYNTGKELKEYKEEIIKEVFK